MHYGQVYKIGVFHVFSQDTWSIYEHGPAQLRKAGV